MRMLHLLSSATLAICLASTPAAFGAEKFPKAPPGAGLPRPPAPAAYTPNPLNLIYTPITPCRVFSVSLPKQQTRTYQITGTGNMTSQGGPVNGCAVPAYAQAVSMRFSAQSVLDGYVTGVASGSTAPAPLYLTYFAGNKVASDNAILPLSANGQFSLYSRQAAQATGDVLGYFEPQIEAMISSGGGIYSGGPRVLSSVRNSTGSYTVTIDRDVTFCAPIVQAYSYGNEAHAYAFNGSTLSLYSFYRNSEGDIVAVDDYIYLTVKC